MCYIRLACCLWKDGGACRCSLWADELQQGIALRKQLSWRRLVLRCRDDAADWQPPEPSKDQLGWVFLIRFLCVSQSLGDETLRRRFWGNLLRNLKAEKLQKLLVHLAVCCDGTWMVLLPILVPSVDRHEMSESKIKEKVPLSNCVSLYKIPCRHFVYE